MPRTALSLSRAPGVHGALLLALLLYFASPALAQFHPLDRPADSPLWWTLTDSLSPEELRAAHRDPQANLERYLKHLDGGWAPSLTEEETALLSFYVNAQRTPELVPAWYAFHVFSRFRVTREGDEAVSMQLGRHGVSQQGRQSILGTAARHRAALEEAISRIGPQQVHFVLLQRRAIEQLGSDAQARVTVNEATARRDSAFLARLGGESEERTRELLAAGTTDSIVDQAAETLPLLRKGLSGADWDAFRRYLLAEVASRMGARPGFAPSLAGD